MSSKLPAVTAKDLVRVAQKCGFVFRRQSGSHAIYVRDFDKARLVVPMHAGATLKRKTLRGMLQDMKLTAEEFMNQL
jgi:predicted RNA binding protein YcfA (HicA-like mRNA interferase family)